jgi:hypothetical protein
MSFSPYDIEFIPIQQTFSAFISSYDMHAVLVSSYSTATTNVKQIPVNTYNLITYLYCEAFVVLLDD